MNQTCNRIGFGLAGAIFLLIGTQLRAGCDRIVVPLNQNSSICDIYWLAGSAPPIECAGNAPKATIGVGCNNTQGVPGTRSLVTKPKTSVPSERSLAVQINFEFNSAELDAMSKSILNQIAQAFRNPDSFESGLILEGHTDGVGSYEYNLGLSKRRARAVYNYLVQNHGIEPSRLRAVGKGERNLLFPDTPAAAANRRVEFVVQTR